MANDKVHAVGDEVTVSGVVTHVGDNGGNPEYTVAVNNPDTDRPISIPPRAHPAVSTNGPVELVEANQKTYDEAAKDSEKAEKEAAKADEEKDADAKPAPNTKPAPPAKSATTVK